VPTPNLDSDQILLLRGQIVDELRLEQSPNTQNSEQD
jgi:hypothetical protein